MRLLQVATGPAEVLELHPRLSIVGGLDRSQRDALVAAVSRLAGAPAPTASGLVEVEGVVAELGADALRVLPAGGSVPDPVVREADLVVAPRPADELDRIERRMDELAGERLRLEAELAAAQQVSRSRPTAAPTEVDVLGAEELEGRVDELRRSLGALAPNETAPVRSALDRLRQLLQERTDTASVAAAQESVERARRVQHEAERALRAPVLDADQVAALEAAHARLIEAVERSDRRFGAARSQQRADSLRAAESEALAELGFASYSDYLMGHSLRPPDPGLQVEVEAASEAVAAAMRELARQQELDHRASELQCRLDEAGVAVAGELFERHELESLAAAWLAEEEDLGRRRTEIEAEVARLSAPVGTAADPGPAEPEARIEAELAALVASEAELDEWLTAALGAPPGLADLVMARIGAASAAPAPGPRPILLDDALGAAGDAEVADLLDRLAAEAGGVQVIVVSDHPAAGAWAGSAGPERAAAVRPTTG